MISPFPHDEMTIEELQAEYDIWNKMANSGNNCNVTAFAHQMREAAAKWIKVREDEIRNIRTESQGNTGS